MPDLLIVDDDEDILALLGSFFRSHAYAVTAASSGAGLFQALSAGAIDLVILDVMMPGEDGLSLCRRMCRPRHETAGGRRIGVGVPKCARHARWCRPAVARLRSSGLGDTMRMISRLPR